MTVVGRGRVGAAVAERLAERGIEVADDGDLQLLCVPDAAISEVAAAIPIGPWVAHVSGATQLGALAPHVNRFSVHPLQTFRRGGGAAQLDGAFAAISADDGDGMRHARWLAETLGLAPFELSDSVRPLYHAGASIASNYLVTLFRSAAALFAEAGAPPEALVPLLERTIENGFDLTGPIARGDTDTVLRHETAISASSHPELREMYDVLARLTQSQHSAP
ncbi:MAG: DUF2520 domain-containing protein [Actinobacteria bacterium]|nr:DUF2520 domain-containing protein [Actinomycetota bacterium]